MKKFGILKKVNIDNLLPCIFYGLVCGLLTGGFIVLFKFLANKCEEISLKVYAFAKSSPIFIALTFIALIAVALLTFFLHKRLPEVRGGGIPRSEGVLRGLLSFNWVRILFGTFLGSMLAFLCGVPVGGEGPAVLMGTAIGAMCLSFSKNKPAWLRYVSSGGAGAGFAVATGAPLTGILFALEEIHKRYTLMLVLTVAVSVVSATLTSSFLCEILGMERRLLVVSDLVDFCLSDTGYLVLLGVLLAVAVVLFDWSIMAFSKFMKKRVKSLPKYFKLVLVFVLTGILAFTISDAVYSGHSVIEYLVHGKWTAGILILLIILRLMMMLFVTDSGVTGGIFIPTLAIGALFGALITKLLLLLGMNEGLSTAIILLSMCAFVGGTLRAPLTATVFFVELTGQFTNLLFVLLVVFIVNGITELINITPFYDKVLKNMEDHEHEGKTLHVRYFEMNVCKNAFVVGEVVKEIMWPPMTVVLCVSRKEENGEVDDVIDKKICVGDKIIMRARYYDKEEFKSSLRPLVGKESVINDYKTLSTQD